ncbi:hypothetical protein SDC9_128928 [bioreactor metagenome]|uniref:Uncharacterized protein n=1 Tax=bioreactor metagenome TaxID=1076179 RepID=A0A645CY96_9ZZZZ
MGEILNDSASGSPTSQLIGGILLPLWLAIPAIAAVISGHWSLPGLMSFALPINPINSRLIGGAQFGIALVLHAHFLWSVTDRLYHFAPFLKIVGLLVFLGGVGTVLVRLFPA